MGVAGRGGGGNDRKSITTLTTLLFIFPVRTVPLSITFILSVNAIGSRAFQIRFITFSLLYMNKIIINKINTTYIIVIISELNISNKLSYST